MRPAHQKVLLALSSTLVALGAAWLVLRSRAAGSIDIVDQSAQVELVLLERQVAPRGLGPFTLRPGLASLPRETIDEATVFRIFPLGPYMQWDPVQYFRYKPHLEERIPFPQHDGGAYVRRTNDDGYREDHDTPRTRPDVFVLATGDSHTDGIGENSESWPNQLEALLAASRPGKSVEVLNAGVQNYSFYHYLASIERALLLGPDVVVTLCYGGNDFVEVLLVHHMFQHTVQPRRTREYWDGLRKLDGVHAPELTQVLYEALYFQRFPDEVERSLSAAAATCSEIQELCAQRNVDWIFAYLPTAYCLPWTDLEPARAADLAALGLSENDLAIVDRLADHLLATLRERGVAVVDLREPLREMARAGEKRPYWDEFHIDVRGQALVAGWLRPAVEAALAAPR